MTSGSIRSENTDNRGHSRFSHIRKKYLRGPAVGTRFAASTDHMDMLVHITGNYGFSICRNNFHRNREFRWINVFCHRKYFFIYDKNVPDSFRVRIIQIRVFDQKHSGHDI